MGKNRRYYFPNTEQNIGGFTISITSGGKPYLVDKGQFKNAPHIITRSGLIVELPSGEKARFYIKDKKVESEIITEEIT